MAPSHVRHSDARISRTYTRKGRVRGTPGRTIWASNMSSDQSIIHGTIYYRAIGLLEYGSDLGKYFNGAMAYRDHSPLMEIDEDGLACSHP
jgi:hypothetical protein